MPTNPAAGHAPGSISLSRELQAGAAGTLISLAPALTLGLLAFAALGPHAAALGIPAALVSSSVGGAVFALLSRAPMAAGGPSAAPVLVLGALVASVVADPAFAVSNPAAVALLLALVAAAVVCMGLFQIVLGLSGLVRFAKFVPQPVLAGFMNGVALLALLTLLPLLFGWPVGALQSSGWLAMPPIQPATLAVGLFTVGVILLLPRLNRKLPANLIGLLAGTGAYLLIHALSPTTALGPLTGTLPMAWPHVDTLWPWLGGLGEQLLQRHAGAALTAGLVMALIGTLELVLNSLAMDQVCRTRTDPRREVLALGTANVVSGLVGGLPLLLLRPRALHMLDQGGRSRAGLLICCALFALLGLAAAPLLSLLPQVVLAGMMVIIYARLADTWSLQLLAQWWRGAHTADVRLALLLVVTVCATTLVLGFPIAVAVGALLSVVLFILSMNRSLVRSRFTGRSMPSRRIYAAEDEARLLPLRERVTLLELEGALFFGSADRVAELTESLESICQVLVLDFRRVSLIDASGALVLSQLSHRLAERGIALLLSGVGADNRFGRMLRQYLGDGFVVQHSAADMDQAMERAELQLLAHAGFVPVHETVPLEEVGLMDGMDAAQRARLAACMQVQELGPGECLFRHGAPGDRLFVITAGAINVFSPAVPGSAVLQQRYVSLSPGMMLGETAMLDGGGRSGEAFAMGQTEVYSLGEDALARLREEDPLVYAQVCRNIALHLAQRLRAAARAWRDSTS